MKSIVIGGSSGMGLAIAKALHGLGHEVVIASRSPEKLKAAQKTIGPDVVTHPLDTTQESQLASFFKQTGPFDHLITTAADFMMSPFLSTTTEEAKRFFDSKFWGQFNAAKYATPHLRKGGSITLFCGAASKKPFKGFSVGSAINAAIEGLTRALALELAPLRVNAIAPGTIVTPVWDVVPEKERLEQFKAAAQQLPVGRVGYPEDVVKLVMYLIDCGYVTGTVNYVDGGLLLT